MMTRCDVRFTILLAVFASFCIVQTARAANPGEAPPGWKITEEMLGNVPSDIRRGLLSPDGTVVAFTSQELPHRLIVNGKPGPELPIRPYQIFLSPTNRIVYLCTDNDRQTLYLDHKALPSFDWIWVSSIISNSNDNLFAYVGGLKAVDQPKLPAPEDDPFAHQGRLAPKLREQRVVLNGKLGPAFDDITPTSLYFRRLDGKLCYVGQRAGKTYLVTGDDIGKGYDSVKFGRVRFTIEGTSNESDGYYEIVDGANQYVLVDGNPHNRVDKVTSGTTVIGRASYRLDDRVLGRVLLAHVGKKVRAYFNGRPSPDFDEIDLAFGLLSDDGKHVMYLAREGANWHVVYDGKPGPPHENGKIHELALGPKDGQYGYLVEFVPEQKRVVGRDFAKGSLEDLKGFYVPRPRSTWICMIDGKASPKYDQIQPLMMYDLKNAGRYDSPKKPTYWNDDGTPGEVISLKKRRPVEGEALKGGELEEGPFAQVVAKRTPLDMVIHFGGFQSYSVLTSPNGRRQARVRGANSKYQLVTDDGFVSPTFESIYKVYFSPDSAHLIYITDRGMMRDDQPINAPAGSLDTLFLNADGSKLAHRLKTAWWVDQLDVLIDEDPYGSKYRLVLDKTGRHLVFRDRTQVFKDGKLMGKFNSFSGWSVTPDGAHLAFAAWRDRKWCMVIDGHPGELYDRLNINGNWVSPRSFRPDGSLIFLAKKGDTLVRVTYALDAR